MATATITTTEQIEVTLSEQEKIELKGDPGEDGQDGANGLDGRDGADGRDGRDGVDGIDGTNGLDGADGQDGQDGADGVNGTPMGLWGVDYRSFPGATDNAKLTAALDYAKAQTRIPNILVTPGDHTWSLPQTPFSGMRIIGPNEGGPMNPEQGSKLVNHRVNCSGLGGFLFTNPGTLFDVFVKGLCFQGGPSARFWSSTGGNGLYAACFDNLTFYGFQSVFGSAATKALLTQANMTGFWQVIGGASNMQFHVGGSDCDFWVDGYCNIGPTNNPSEGEFQFFFDGFGKANVGSLYCTAGGTKGIRVSGNSEGTPINFHGMRLEGKPGGAAATDLLQIDSGVSTFLQCWFAYAARISIAAGADADFALCKFKSVASGVPAQ